MRRKERVLARLQSALLIAILVLHLTFPGGAQAFDITRDIPLPMATLELEGVSVRSVSLDDSQDFDEAKALVVADLKQTLARDPRTAISIVNLLDEPGANRSPGSSNESEIETKIREVAGRQVTTKTEQLPRGFWDACKSKFGSLFQNYRRNITIVRAGIAGTTTTWTVLNSSVPIELALVVGAVAGLLSGTVQWHNGKFLNWLTANTILKKVFRLTDERIASLSISPEEMARWFMLEAGFLGAIHLTMAMIGVDSGRPLLVTAGLSFLAQAGFDLANGTSRSRALEATQDEATQKKIQRRSDVYSALISGLSVTGAVMDLAGIPIGKIGLVVMAAGGWPLYLWIKNGLTIEGIQTKVKRWIRGCDRYFTS